MRVCCQHLIKPCFFLALLGITQLAQADQLIIEPEMGRAPLLEAIERTQHTLSLAMYGLTDETLLNAITKQKQLGRTVNVFLEQHPYKNENENETAIQAFKTQKVAWQGVIPPYRFIHQKTLILDNKQAIVMTFNFTHASFKNERNFALIIDDPITVHDITAVFNADWQHTPIGTHATELIYSPNDSRSALLKQIKNARHTLNIYQQSVSDFDLVGALAKAAQRGVKINLLLSHPPRQKQADYLKRAGVVIKTSKHYYIHAKVLMIDGETAILGSINFTRASLNDNRELAILTRDKTVVRQLETTFYQDFGASKRHKKTSPQKTARLTAQQRYFLRHFLKLID